MPVRNVGKRARFTAALDSVKGQALQNQSDIEDMMGITQDTIEDVMKVVLVGLKQTDRLVDEALDELYETRDGLERQLNNMGPHRRFLERKNMNIVYWALPWWKRLVTRRPW